MADFIASGRVVDVILIVIAIEALALVLYRRTDRTRFGLVAIALALGPGVFLLLALRAALVGDHWAWVALWLGASFPVHLLDLRRRNLRR
ncbi:MAG: hypothetical protein GC206_02370 [Alphaproteobacteria bacterium]|nr:hypothetical protein [Alphaproteobacteria bacterium]